jgi:chemosensory pili system protein ChpA (sensor histidine kinase/response regulator)
VAHGIEAPGRAHRRGQASRSGTITVDLRQEGNDVSVEFRDDGAGLDLPASAKRPGAGLMAAAPSATPKLANLIFMPGFSTATEVTGWPGAASAWTWCAEVNAWAAASRHPPSRARAPASAGAAADHGGDAGGDAARGELAVGVPANLVESCACLGPAELEQAYSDGFTTAGERCRSSGRAPAAVFARSAEPQARRAGGDLPQRSQRVAMHVDEVLGNQEVVVKNLGPQLSACRAWPACRCWPRAPWC